MAPSLSTNPRQRQLREDMRQALSSADASQLRRLSLQVIHRQGPEVLQRLMQLLAEGEQLRFWLDALQPVKVAVAPQPQVRSAQPAIAVGQAPLAEPEVLPLQSEAGGAEGEPATPEVDEEPRLAAAAASGNPECSRPEAVEVASPEQPLEPPVTAFSGAVEPVEEPEAQAASDFKVVSVAEPEALALQTDVAVDASEPATPEVDEKPLLAAEAVIQTPEVGEPLEAVAPLQAVEPLEADQDEEVSPVQPKPIREESIKFAAPPKRVVATPAPLERSRLNQRLKGWLPGSGCADRQAA